MTDTEKHQDSGIRDNYLRKSLGSFLKEKIAVGTDLSFVSAYFTIYAFEALQKQLEGIQGLDFLFGEPRFINFLDPQKTEKKAFKIEDEGLALQNRLKQKRIARDCAAWIKEKARIRSVKYPDFLHGKMYHIRRPNGDPDAILGSSNFTVSGLGLGSSRKNIELNLIVNDRRDFADLRTWFDEIWESDKVVDVKNEVLEYLAQLYQNHSPEFIYLKTLFHIFERFREDQDRNKYFSEQKDQLVDTQIWKTLYQFQKDGVIGAINKIQNHNGCILADSVGLGKTYEALAVIKHFELFNHKVLVLCPKKLRENWTVYQAQNNSELNPFVNDRFAYTVLSHTDLSREEGLSGDIDLSFINWANYDLVVIDESHNFRNNTRGKRDEEGRPIRKSRYERLMEDIIRKGVKTKVLLLSATPVNNDLKDLRNQIYFITEGRDDALTESLGIPSLRDTLANAQRIFKDWAKHNEAHRVDALLSKLSANFFKLLDDLTIARSRKHIHKYYAESIEEIGGFPKRLKPISIHPPTDLDERFMSYDRLNREIGNYRLSLFNPSKYVCEEFWDSYEEKTVKNFTQKDREHYLINMMKVNFLKRLESSVHSFAITMTRTIEKIEKLQDRIRRFQHFRNENPEEDFETIDIEAFEDEDLIDALQVGEKLKFKMAHLDTEAWLKDLRQDREQLNLLYLSARDVTPNRDAKLAELKKLIKNKIQKPSFDKIGKPNRKVLVFTAFGDTAAYLYDQLVDWARSEFGIHTALVVGTGGNKTTLGRTHFHDILTNFSPISKNRSKLRAMPQGEAIDLLIASDCISEGQNLQDCDYLINYDIHWNPVRIIQRFGRIDRLGSINKEIQLVNFWPTPDLNQYIDLKNRVEARMALVDIAATFEDNLLAADDIEGLIKDDLTYRDRQLLKLKDEVLDLEDFGESVALNEFTLDDFRMDLIKHLEERRHHLETAPLGLYAVVPPNPEVTHGVPGVVFCLRHKTPSGDNRSLNPLYPYFLIYIRNDKVVRFNFTQPKQILELYHSLCSGKTEPLEELCRNFDYHTKDGEDMTFYNKLLDKVVASAAKHYQKRAIGQLQTNRGGLLPRSDEQVRGGEDFELITWLVIQ